MKITKVKVEEIKQYKYNSKLHPEWQIEQIKKSIKQFGFNDPLAIDENNIIIEGHGRFQALKELGYKEIEVIKLDHLTEQEKKAYIIAHNKININTGFDLDILKKELSDITEFDVDLTGFTDFEIENLFVADNFEDTNDDIEEIEDFNETYNIKICFKDHDQLQEFVDRFRLNIDTTRQILKINYEDLI